MVRSALYQPSDPFARRAAGVLLHPTSLPGPLPGGDVGPEAHAFLDFLSRARLSIWQMLPVHPPDCVGSPYRPLSAFAGSPWLVSPRALVGAGLLAQADLEECASPPADRIDLGAQARVREALLRRAFEAAEAPASAIRDRLATYLDEAPGWLADHALFAALKREHGGAPWSRWPRELRRRKPAALRAARGRLQREIRFHAFVQLVFDEQWKELRRRARAAGVLLIGDVPLFVAADGADCWSDPGLFGLGRDGRVRRSAGSPPLGNDRRGQVWGLPPHDWTAHEREGFAWWIARFARGLELFDGLRLDHFPGLVRTWAVPVRHRTARRGAWEAAAGDELLSAARTALGRLPVVVEDLGDPAPEVDLLRERFALPGMRVVQLGFRGGDEPDEHHPESYPTRSVAYSGNHDTDTLRGWLAGLPPEGAVRQRVRAAVHDAGTPASGTGTDDAHEARGLMDLVLASRARTAIVQLQDLLGLGSEARMNRPGTVGGNWTWRAGEDALSGARSRALAEDLARQIEASGRDAAGATSASGS